MLKKKLGMLILLIQLTKKLVKTKTNSKYCIGYLDKAIRPLVLIRLKINEYFKAFKCK